MASKRSTVATGDEGDGIAISVTDAPPTLTADSRKEQTNSSFSTVPTGTLDKDVISVKDAQPIAAKSPPVCDRFPVFLFVYLCALYYLEVLVMIQTMFKEEKPSPFEIHRGLMMISYLALSVTALASGILLYTRKYLLNSRREAIFGFISIFFAFLATFCLVLVFYLPKNLTWVGYLVIAVTFVIAIGCYLAGCKSRSLHQKEDVCYAREVIHADRICSNYSVTLLPLPIVLVLFVPDNLGWLRWWVDGAAILIAIAYNTIVYLKKKSVNAKVECDLENIIQVKQ